jgi:hypothetical protein
MGFIHLDCGNFGKVACVIQLEVEVIGFKECIVFFSYQPPDPHLAGAIGFNSKYFFRNSHLPLKAEAIGSIF